MKQQHSRKATIIMATWALCALSACGKESGDHADKAAAKAGEAAAAAGEAAKAGGEATKAAGAEATAKAAETAAKAGAAAQEVAGQVAAKAAVASAKAGAKAAEAGDQAAAAATTAAAGAHKAAAKARAAAANLAAVRGPKPATGKPTFAVEGKGGRYTFQVTLEPDPPALGKLFKATTKVMDLRERKPAASERFSLDFTMPHHGHGMMTKPQHTRVSDGVWVTEGLKLHMHGDWVAEVRVGEGADEDAARYTYKLEPVAAEP